MNESVLISQFIDNIFRQKCTTVKLGEPVLDKLLAWKLTNYSKLLFLDADVMALRSLDSAFEWPELSIAAHPYDTVQVSPALTMRAV